MSEKQRIACAKQEFPNALVSGYHHYWDFHNNEKMWAHAGCPVCKAKERQASTKEES